MIGDRRRPTGRYALLGLVTLMVVAAIGLMSYRANRGLPLESQYHVTVDVPDAARLAVNGAVRIGGVRVGQVDGVTARRASAGGRPFARIELRLGSSVGRLPADTRVQVRTASPLGGTFVELTPGRSDVRIPDGGRLGLRNADSSVQVADLLEMFDRATRRGLQQIVADGGPGLVGRGADLNATLANLARLAGPAERVFATLTDPRTNLSRFLRGYERTIAELAPVTGGLTSLLRSTARTFAALTSDPASLDAAIVRASPAELAATRALDGIDPSLARLTVIARRLRPGTERLTPALGELDGTLRLARQPLRALRPVSGLLENTLAATDRLARAPATPGSLRKLNSLTQPLERLFSAVTPAQAQCNVYGVFMENATSVLGVTGTREGSFELASVSTLGGSNELFQNAKISPDLNVDATPNLSARECEAGNEPYSRTNPNRGNPPGLQYDHWRETVQPPGVRAKAQAAGLYDSPGEGGR